MQVTGTFLYTTRAFNGKILTALSDIASAQSAPTKYTMKKCKKKFDYGATQPDAILMYRSINMVLYIHRNVSYLNKPKARSRVVGHHFISINSNFPSYNSVVLNISQIIKSSHVIGRQIRVRNTFHQ